VFPRCRATELRWADTGDRRIKSGWSTFGDWDYWTRDGAWVLWNGRTSRARLGAGGQVINIDPDLHNFTHSPWPARLFFRCVDLH
jgi:hypothetical protein